jgi:hypothetical protein
MSRKIIYCLRTQNELTDLIPNIEAALPYVDKVVCLDGGSKDLTLPYMRNWALEEPKIYFGIDPWKDDFPAARNAYVKKAAEFVEDPNNTWLLTADPDEYFDPLTFEKLQKAIDRAEQDGRNMIGFQCRSVSLHGSKRVWENLDEYWKHLLIKWDPNFHYTGYKCHEGKGGVPHNIMNTGLVYEHRKQNNVIWIRGHRNLFTAGGGPNLGERNPIWVKLRKLCSEKLGLNTWHQYYDYLLQGNIDSELKQIYIDHMFEGRDRAGPNAVSNKDWDGSSEMREMYKSYYRFLHPEEEPEEFKGVHLD